jgi:hypothetical protein
MSDAIKDKQKKQLGRPVGTATGRKKECKLTVVCSHELKEKVNNNARKAGLSESAYLLQFLQAIIKT